MAHINEREYLRQFLVDWPVTGQGRVLNIGAAHSQGIDYAPLFPDRQIVGVDQEPGEGVDIVADMTGSLAEMHLEEFAAVLCCSVLEHCKWPHKMAENIYELLGPGALLYVTVPWIWRFHKYPSDYWRMSPEGVKLLFDGIRWKRIAYATQKLGEFLGEGQPHDDGEPWREVRDQRVYLCSQFVCMIGRKE